MFGLTKKIFFILLTTTINACNHTKCVLFSNQKCMNQRTLINLDPNEYNQELRYYSFAVNLDRYSGSCGIIDDLSSRICVPNEIKDLNLHVFNMITVRKESRKLTRHILCKCESKFDSKRM